MSQSGSHDEFLELCAASTSSELSDDEQKLLQDHLAACAACREALRQYETIVSDVIPAIAAGEEPERVPLSETWSQGQQEQAEKALFDRLADEKKHPPGETGKRNGSSIFLHRILPFSSESTWRNVWMLYAAGTLLFCALGFFAYRVGMHRAADIAKRPQPQPTKQEAVPTQASLEEQLSDAGHDRAVANAEIIQRDKMIADLRRRLARQSSEIDEMKAAQNQLESDLRAGDDSRQDLSQEKNQLTEKLESAQSNSRSLQEKLDLLAQQSTQDAGRAKASEAKASDLTHELQEQQGALERRDELLAHDRDIREVIGARDLYICGNL